MRCYRGVILRKYSQPCSHVRHCQIVNHMVLTADWSAIIFLRERKECVRCTRHANETPKLMFNTNCTRFHEKLETFEVFLTTRKLSLRQGKTAGALDTGASLPNE